MDLGFGGFSGSVLGLRAETSGSEDLCLRGVLDVCRAFGSKGSSFCCP